MKEIERKFLVNSLKFKDEAVNLYSIEQGFLSTDKERTVRVRLNDNSAFITVKGISSEDGLERFEWEKEISTVEAKALLKLCIKPIIEKTRYEVKSGNHLFEIDEFYGENEGLVIAEIELKSKSESFIKPEWLGKEVTGQLQYYNSQLISKPFNKWNE